MKKKILIGVGILFLLGVIGLYKYIVFETNYVSSNAVFVKSDTLTFLSFKLPGKIEKLFVKEGEKVKKGTLLAKLDTSNLEIQKEELNSTINALTKKIEATKIQKDKLSKDIDNQLKLLNIQISKLKKTVKAKEFDLKSDEYRLQKLNKDFLRFKKLFLVNKVSKEKFESVKTQFLALKEGIKAKKSLIEAMRDDIRALDVKINLTQNSKKEIKRLSKLIGSMEFDKKALKDKLKLVLQNIKDSYLYAPFDGVVAKRFANAKEVIRASQKVFSIVDLKKVYVLDLLEEIKLKGIKIGSKATVHIDALDKDFKGVVSEILPASAATFALVPRDISSGEFTKLAQRFYVKIKFLTPPKGVLVGMSGEVKIKKESK